MSELRLLKLGSAGSPASFVVQGGYFESARGLDKFARNSLKKALELGAALVKQNPQNRVTYSLLINDLGLSCAGDVCEIFSAPSNTVDLGVAMEEARALAGDKGDAIIPSTERHMRNWGFRRLKKIFKDENWRAKHPRFRSEGVNDRVKWILQSKMGGNILLFEESGLSWIAKCPLIMGAYYARMLEQAGSDEVDAGKVVIDLCSPSDRDKVVKGAETAFTLFRPRRRQDVVMPVLCDLSCQTMLPITQFSMDLG